MFVKSKAYCSCSNTSTSIVLYQKVMVLSAEQALQLAEGEGSVVVTVADDGEDDDGIYCC